VENARFLGVYTDEKLQWNEHISQISAKVSKNIGILKENKSPSKYICVITIV